MVKTYHNRFQLQWHSDSQEPTVLLLTYSLSKQEKKAHLDFVVPHKANLKIMVLVYLKQQSQLSLFTTQNHLQPESSSNLICKAVVDKQSRFSYQGKIIIHKKAREAHAYQRNENLILDNSSEVISQPNLEILANQVYCTHGSFTSSLDQNQIYYLQTRGLSAKKAKTLLTKSFLLSSLYNYNNCFSARQLHNLEKTTLAKLAFSS